MIFKTLKTMKEKCQENTDSFKKLLKDQTLTTNQRRSIAAKILGVHRRYKQVLIVHGSCAVTELNLQVTPDLQ